MDELLYPKLTLKVIGFQWYWTYEYSDAFIYSNFIIDVKATISKWLFTNKTYVADIKSMKGSKYSNEYRDLIIESYMIPDADLDFQRNHRLLSVDQSIVLPTYTHIRVLVTGADVLHSWAVPSLGIKIDAVPGRLNQVAIYIKREGIFYGQCSELCGVNHGFMPIVVKSVTSINFIDWVRNAMFAKFKAVAIKILV
jgi:heme/copper-type cytochrome/quinol oxidase subunit 2